MSATNPITGDLIQTKTVTQEYRNNYDSIFRKSVVQDVLPEKEKTDDK